MAFASFLIAPFVWLVFLSWGILKLLKEILEFMVGKFGDRIAPWLSAPVPDVHIVDINVQSTRLYIDKGTVWVGEEDFAYWSFSYSNPDKERITIRSELFSDGKLVASREETSDASARGFALPALLKWDSAGRKLVHGFVAVIDAGGSRQDIAEQRKFVQVNRSE
jgi:hypothetical protein